MKAAKAEYVLAKLEAENPESSPKQRALAEANAIFATGELATLAQRYVREKLKRVKSIRNS
ncbi:hypothetical protein JW962_01820 [Candidatus Dojkabacteria bacterium]|nr:hypothetical protein [Candidatus Dojkabacteria bacterium]